MAFDKIEMIISDLDKSTFMDGWGNTATVWLEECWEGTKWTWHE